MGAFYESVQIRTGDREAVRTVLEELARKKKRRFLLGPVLNGWVGVYAAGDVEATARQLARALCVDILALLVHDDDFFVWSYYRDGKCVDQYNSAPDYFQETSDKQRRKLRGRPELLAHLASDAPKFQALCDLLAAQQRDPVVFASELLGAFAEALGIRNALTSYMYLKEHEETDDIEGWDHFLHVPDLSDENAQRRQRDTALQEQKQQLMQQGWLLAERGGLRGITSPMPWWCPSPDGRGFLVAWSSHADPGEAQLALERHGPPWSAGPATTPWTIAPHIYGLELSASGRYLAVAHAAGDWHATVWDLSEKRLVADVPQVRAVSSVGFLPDESAVYSVSSDGHTGRLVITPLDGTKARVFQLQHANRAVVHPSGAWLVVTDSYQRLFVVDLASGEVRLAGPVGGPSPWGSLGRLFTGRAGSAQSEGGAEGVFCLRFDPSGDCLCLGTMNGIRVLPWPEVRDADGTLPAPSLAVDVRGKTFAREGARGQFGGYIYDLEHDAKRNRLLFAGLEGRVRYLDLDTGLSGSLLEVPALPPIQRLSLSRDGMTLGLTCFPDMFSHSRNKRGPVLQFWSYETISSAQAPHGGAG